MCRIGVHSSRFAFELNREGRLQHLDSEPKLDHEPRIPPMVLGWRAGKVGPRFRGGGEVVAVELFVENVSKIGVGLPSATR